MAKRGRRSVRTTSRTYSPGPGVHVAKRHVTPVRVVSTDASPLSRLQRVDLAQVLREIEDRRLHHPERFDRPALNFRGHPAPVIVGRSRPRPAKRFSSAMTWPSHVIAFRDPQSVLTCVRRSSRREVLFASRKTGAGAKSRRRFSWRSKLSCKR